jgi:hypothetical protein
MSVSKSLSSFKELSLTCNDHYERIQNESYPHVLKFDDPQTASSVKTFIKSHATIIDLYIKFHSSFTTDHTTQCLLLECLATTPPISSSVISSPLQSTAKESSQLPPTADNFIPNFSSLTTDDYLFTSLGPFLIHFKHSLLSIIWYSPNTKCTTTFKNIKFYDLLITIQFILWKQKRPYNFSDNIISDQRDLLDFTADFLTSCNIPEDSLVKLPIIRTDLPSKFRPYRAPPNMSHSIYQVASRLPKIIRAAFPSWFVPHIPLESSSRAVITYNGFYDLKNPIRHRRIMITYYTLSIDILPAQSTLDQIDKLCKDNHISTDDVDPSLQSFLAHAPITIYTSVLKSVLNETRFTCSLKFPKFNDPGEPTGPRIYLGFENPNIIDTEKPFTMDLQTIYVQEFTSASPDDPHFEPIYGDILIQNTPLYHLRHIPSWFFSVTKRPESDPPQYYEMNPTQKRLHACWTNYQLPRVFNSEICSCPHDILNSAFPRLFHLNSTSVPNAETVPGP